VRVAEDSGQRSGEVSVVCGGSTRVYMGQAGDWTSRVFNPSIGNRMEFGEPKGFQHSQV
jgi:hypothetical protein